jgi:hypothetical protein
MCPIRFVAFAMYNLPFWVGTAWWVGSSRIGADTLFREGLTSLPLETGNLSNFMVDLGAPRNYSEAACIPCAVKFCHRATVDAVALGVSSLFIIPPSFLLRPVR